MAVTSRLNWAENLELTDLSGVTITAPVSEGEVLIYKGGEWVNDTPPSGVTDHGLLTGLGDDDHTQYALLAGRAGGQILIGGTAASEGLTFSSTSNITKGLITFGSNVYINETTGRIGVGTNAPTNGLEVKGSSGATVRTTRFVASTGGSIFWLTKSRVTAGSESIVQADDTIGELTASGHDGSTYQYLGRIRFLVDGTPGSGDMPGRIVFQTTPDGSSTPVERARIDCAGSTRFTPNGTNEILKIATDQIYFKTVRETSALPFDDVTTGPISGTGPGGHASIAAAIQGAYDLGSASARTDIDLIGNRNGSNKVFTTPDKFVQDTNLKIAVYWQGRRLKVGRDYTVSESGGPGTGYDTITMTPWETAGYLPQTGDELVADYYVD